MNKKGRIGIIVIAMLGCVSCYSQKSNSTFSSFIAEFNTAYQKLNIPQLEYDYKAYFKAIPDTGNLNAQAVFFNEIQNKLSARNYNSLKKRDKLHYDQLVYECKNNLQRIALEKKWVTEGRVMPLGGLHALAENKDWYNLFTKRFTSLEMSPEDIYKLGISETKMVHEQITSIKERLGFHDSAKFYQYLKSDTFLLKDKNEILKRYAIIDSTVRKNLNKFISVDKVPKVFAMEWPNADKFTPPGMYVNRAYNAYGKDVFQFNFYGGVHNVRAMEWLYMHEAIPGHHLQFTESSRESKDDSILQQLFLYPGNFEGWACYVEYFGKDIGLYQSTYTELGKWEWDLVRSVRVVLDVGIHYYGWDFNKAMEYWKANIPGQDAIAEREITRITNWPGQVLSYKVGANKIKEMKEKYIARQGSSYDVRKFHALYLNLGMLPLVVMEKYITG
ncbi:MAG TPA: DUF885 domain-containing protein [Bacteroidia bacterium]|nr:DUF885 domain-containing protein [Bacteroidia bacterium]